MSHLIASVPIWPHYRGEVTPRLGLEVSYKCSTLETRRVRADDIELGFEVRVEGMVVLDGVTEVKDGESCTFFGAIDMAIGGMMCFGKIHDERVVRAQTVDEKRMMRILEGRYDLLYYHANLRS